jgi:uncharacterized membrane protein YbaN (DUF454 family)
MKNKTRARLLKFHNSKKFIGLQLMFIGILGLFLPILPGVIIIFLGLRFIFPDIYKRFKKSIDKAEPNV